MLPGLFFLGRVIKHVAQQRAAPSSHRAPDEFLPLGQGGGSEGQTWLVHSPLPPARLPTYPRQGGARPLAPSTKVWWCDGYPEKTIPEGEAQTDVLVANKGSKSPQEAFSPRPVMIPAQAWRSG